MKKVFVALACMVLAACSVVSPGTDLAINAGAAVLDSSPIAKPVTIADNSVLDERAGVAAEAAYTAWRTFVEIGTDAGLITGSRATWAKQMDATLYAHLAKVRHAYWTANSATYQDAAREAKSLIEAAIAQLNGGN